MFNTTLDFDNVFAIVYINFLQKNQTNNLHSIYHFSKECKQMFSIENYRNISNQNEMEINEDCNFRFSTVYS